MRAAAFLLPFRGHVYPALPLLERLSGVGVDVVVYSSERFEKVIRATGSRFAAYRAKEFARLEESLHRAGGMALLSRRLLESTRGFLAEDLRSVEAFEPDVILHDSNSPWGREAVRRSGVPGVSMNPSFAWNRRIVRMARGIGTGFGGVQGFAAWAWHGAATAVVARRLGMTLSARPVLDELFLGRQDLNLVFTSRDFQPHSDHFGSTFLFVGASVDEWEPEPDFPWDRIGAESIILVSLGTIFNRDPGPYRVFIDALSNLGLPVVVSTGWGRSSETFSSDPNVIVRQSVPQMRLLGQTALFVSHGGVGGVSKALSSGVPVIVSPGLREQALVGTRVEELGAGRVIRRKALTVARLRETAREILSDPAYAGKASLIGRSLVSQDGLSEAVERILELGRNGRTRDDATT